MSKIKIFNDPVYGFVRIPQDIIFRLIDHPWFQRLRRIQQLGLTHLVYPGALHTRFHHAIGAFHLLTMALDNLKSKGVEITDAECEAVSIAVLLHDIGHGPFSHALENVLVRGIHHEEITLRMMEELNLEFDGRLSLTIRIFKGEYHKKFLHQLVSSQLDTDRLDYLRRDSFYTGVIEGFIGVDRIIQMMDVANNNLVIEVKGIYSIEKFLLARRLMYWQVYLHKTVLSAEQMLINIMERARILALSGADLFATPALSYFLHQEINRERILMDSETLSTFAALDDADVMASVKTWVNHPDPVLSGLCHRLINRHLLKISLANNPYPVDLIENLRNIFSEQQGITLAEASFFIFSDQVANTAYTADDIQINIQLKDGSIKDIAMVSDQYDLNILSRKVTKYYLCYPASLKAQIQAYENKNK
jgi:HD superfamily phosphohydrolase